MVIKVPGECAVAPTRLSDAFNFRPIADRAKISRHLTRENCAKKPYPLGVFG